MAAQKHPHPPYHLVVMAASYGGVQALGEVLGYLPADFPAPIAIVQHRSTEPPNMLARVLGRHTPLTVKTVEEGETLRPGTVYLALRTSTSRSRTAASAISSTAARSATSAPRPIRSSTPPPTCSTAA